MKGGWDPLWGYDIKGGSIEVADDLTLPYSLTSVTITENIDARSHIGYWQGTINYSDLTAGALTEDVKFIDAFPAKYKILEIMVDVTAVFDDGAGPVSACDLSIGWTGANYGDLIQSQDVHGAVTQIGDAAIELNYIAIQGGIRPNWAATTDLYLRFVAVGGNLDTLVSGRLIIYVTYQAYE